VEINRISDHGRFVCKPFIGLGEDLLLASIV